jgi:hypothetical protein
MHMRRKLLIAVLAFGTVAGFGSGFFSLARGGCRNHHERRAAFERHVADVCVEAANRANDRHHHRHRHPGERPPPERL